MWRAFGGASARVALVFKFPLNPGVAAPLRIIFSPVAYFTDAQVEAELHSVIENVRANKEFLRHLDRPILINVIFTMLVAAVVSLKHEGFKEEKEWRIIHSPQRNPSALITSSIEVIDGIPQMIYELPLDRAASEDLLPLDLARVLDRIILGPTQYPWPMHQAFATTMLACGIPDAVERVVPSGIPIRT